MATKEKVETVDIKKTMPTAPPRLRPVQIPVQTLKGVLNPEWQTAVNAEHWFYNQGQNVTFLCVDNTGETAVELVFQTSPDFEAAPVIVSGRTVAHIGPFPALHYNNGLNQATFEMSAAEGVRLAVERLGV